MSGGGGLICVKHGTDYTVHNYQHHIKVLDNHIPSAKLSHLICLFIAKEYNHKKTNKDSCSLAYAEHFSSCRQVKYSTCHLFVRLLCVEAVIAQEGPTTKTFFLSL